MNAAAYLLELGEPEKVVIASDDGSTTYARLRERVARAAATWRLLGVGEGDRLLVLAPDSIDWVLAYMGAIWAGGVAMGPNSRLLERELSPRAAPGMRGAALTRSGCSNVVCRRQAEPLTEPQFEAMVDRQLPVLPAERDTEDPAFWIYTSGTTGSPKAVVTRSGAC